MRLFLPQPSQRPGSWNA